MEDSSLHCNWLKCRKSLIVEGKAVVTTCSHIFCVPCAEQLFTADKACPACKTILDQPDDVVMSSLNPSADYRTSVLAGLSPDVVVDVAARSLAFWQYQQSQEAAYQAMVLKSAQDRVLALEQRHQALLVQANGEINLLQQKVTSLEKDAEADKRRIRELQETIRLATKDYEKLKTRNAQLQRSAQGLSTASTVQSRDGVPAAQRMGGNGFRNIQTPQQGSDVSFWQTPGRSYMPGNPNPSSSTAAINGNGTAYTHATSSNHNRFLPGGGGGVTGQNDQRLHTASQPQQRQSSSLSQPARGPVNSIFGQKAKLAGDGSSDAGSVGGGASGGGRGPVVNGVGMNGAGHPSNREGFTPSKRNMMLN